MPLALVNVANVSPRLYPLAVREGEAARLLGVSRPKFREIADKAKIPHTYHPGGNSRIWLVSDLQAYLESREKFTLITGNPPVNFSIGKK